MDQGGWIYILYKWNHTKSAKQKNNTKTSGLLLNASLWHKTIIFTETGNQSINPKDLQLPTNLGFFDFPNRCHEATGARVCRFFCYLGTFFARFIYGERRRGTNHAPDASKVSQRSSLNRTKKRDPTWWFFFGEGFTPPKTNGWNLKMMGFSNRNGTSSRGSGFRFQPFVFGGLSSLKSW